MVIIKVVFIVYHISPPQAAIFAIEELFESQYEAVPVFVS